MPSPITLRFPSRRRVAGGIGALSALSLATLLAAAPARAQGAGDGFLLGSPIGSLTVRAGYDRATAGSDIFSEARRNLTLSKGDFGGASISADLGVRLSDRFDFVLGGGVTGSSARSHDRDYIDNDDLPIEQTTKLTRVPLSASVKAYLMPRGRSIGKFAWIPSRFTPYVGGGVGLLWYRYEQAGDFVNYETLDVFNNTFTASKWTREAHVMAGADYSVSPRLALTSEVRYMRGHAALPTDTFSGFAPIDLSGTAVTAGLAVRF